METSEEERAGRRRPLWWAVGAAALLLVAIVLTALARPKGVQVQVVGVKRGDLIVPVQCDGTLEPPPGGELRAAEAATVAEIPARDGDRVTAGTPLVRLENAELSQKALDARSEALRLAADRASAEAELADLAREEKHRREVFEADGRLLASGAISRAAADADERALRQAEDNLRAARARLAGLDGPVLAPRARREVGGRVRAPRRGVELPCAVGGRRLRPAAPRRRNRCAGTGRRERRRLGAPATPGPRRPAGPPARREGPARDRVVRRPAARALGRPRDVRLAGALHGGRPRRRRSPRRGRRSEGAAADQRRRRSADRDRRKERHARRAPGGGAARRRQALRLPCRGRAGAPQGGPGRPVRFERRRDRFRPFRKGRRHPARAPRP